MADLEDTGKQNLTLRLDRQTIRMAKILAAKRSTSISGLLARQIEILVGEEEAYERAERQALTLLDQLVQLSQLNCLQHRHQMLQLQQHELRLYLCLQLLLRLQLMWHEWQDQLK